MSNRDNLQRTGRSNRAGRRRPKKKNHRKGIIILIIILIFAGAGTLVAKNMQHRIAVKQEQERLEKERKARIEREKRMPIVGAKKEARKAYGVDARKVWDRLDSYDYSNDGKKMVFLTFDDGPSTTVTPKILDTLKKENVHATFFIKGNSLEVPEARQYLKRAFDEGNAIGNHTYSHNYHKLYPGRVLNLDHFVSDINKNQDELKKILGPKFKTNVVRCPGGYMSWKNMEPLKEYLDKNKMASIDWNALNGDAEGKKKNPQELYNEAVKTSQGKDVVVILMHDTYGKENTAAYLENIIKYYKENGYEFKILV